VCRPALGCTKVGEECPRRAWAFAKVKVPAVLYRHDLYPVTIALHGLGDERMGVVRARCGE
jgi:hypothetical protein